MDFDGSLAQAQGDSDLSVAFSVGQKFGNLALAGRELIESPLEIVELEKLGSPGLIDFKGIIYGADKHLAGAGFLDEGYGAALENAHGSCDVRGGGEKDDRHPAATLHQGVLKLWPGHVGHADVQKQTAAGSGINGLQELLSRVECFAAMSGSAENASDEPAHKRFIIDDENRRLCVG